MDYIIKDESLNMNGSSFLAYNNQENSLKVGTVRDAYESETDEVKYIVEVQHNGNTIPIVCSLMTRWGGAQNFEDYGPRSYKGNDGTDAIGASDFSYNTRVGDLVLVGCINGNYREGVILGGIKHPSRENKVKMGDIAYISQFNGLEKTISTDGTYKVTNKALISTALDVAIPGVPVLPEIPNPVLGGSFYELSSDGSFTISDNVMQSIKIDKTGFATTITSGNSSITLTPLKVETNSQFCNINSKFVDIQTEIITSAATFTSIEATQMAIGSEGFELFQGLIDIIDALGDLVVTSPSGPCNPLKTAPTWIATLELIKTKITAIKWAL